ncbi:MAG: alpha-galactosidase [Clostridia bacterium]|nr:alpha-galactosidase [Clostridia bacterium]
MPIRYSKKDKTFTLTTSRTKYMFRVLDNGYLLHRFYGKKSEKAGEYDAVMVSFSPYFKELGHGWSPDTFPQELSFFGAGDFRTAALKLRGADGSCVTDFRYKSFRYIKGTREAPSDLPFARAGENTETLAVKLADEVTGCVLTLYYTVYYDEDVITRYISLENRGKSPVKIEKCMSMTLDLPSCDYDMISLYGAHYDERHVQRVKLHHGMQSVCSRRGASSPQYNPFFAIASPKTTEERGEVYGINLVWSGSFLDEVEVDQRYTARVQCGLGEENFGYTLERGDKFFSPEAVMTYSSEGFGKMTRNLHSFTRKFILPEGSADRPHPVVLNTWEGSLFNINEEKLLKFAGESAKIGFDMLVMDDGWFGERKNDWAALGDWYPNAVKFSRGLKPFAEDVKAKGVAFGIWIEPEMVNPDSDLYRAHPEWALSVPGRVPSETRQQLVLDMANPDVIEYLKNIFKKTFDKVPIDYFKWDANRHLSDVYSHALPTERQDEVPFRFMKGTYSLLKWFRETYPNAVIETCSGGGGRYDLGMMAYGFQIWTSDNTNPYSRTDIQRASLVAYPAATMSCHVSNPWGNMRSLDFRYKVAVGGMLGYEMDILKVSEEERREMARQTAEYKTYEHVVREGDYYSVVSPVTNDHSAYYYSYDGGREIVFSLIEKKDAKRRATKRLKIKTAINGKTYVDRLSGKKYEGRALLDGLTLEITGVEDTATLMYLVAED